ncbi:hypothetical protein Tco_0062021, partial [Tanacetum coccineum]
LDEYAIRNKIIELQTTELNTKISETAGKTNNVNTEKPNSASESVVSNSKINRDRVIIEDWNSDDEEEYTNKNSLHRNVILARHVSTAKLSVSTARPISTARPSVSTARPVSTARSSVSTARAVYATRPIYPKMDNIRPRG